MSLKPRVPRVSSDIDAASDAPASCPCGGQTLRVAFASSDLTHVDEHFGSASRFACYEVVCHTATLRDVCEFDETQQDGNENKLVTKLETLADCQAMYCLAVGASAVRQLLAAGIQPIKVGAKAPIDDVLQTLIDEIHAGRTPWIEKLKRQSGDDQSRFNAMLDDTWEE